MKNGYTAVQMLVLIVVLGVATLVIVGSTSNAFVDNSDNYYEETTNMIIKQAVLYGESLDNLKDEDYLIITLSDLVKNGYYVADDEEGNVIDPRNDDANLNGLKIKLMYNDGEVKAIIMED